MLIANSGNYLAWKIAAAHLAVEFVVLLLCALHI
jgi:hypothetical protein